MTMMAVVVCALFPLDIPLSEKTARHIEANAARIARLCQKIVPKEAGWLAVLTCFHEVVCHHDGNSSLYFLVLLHCFPLRQRP